MRMASLRCQRLSTLGSEMHRERSEREWDGNACDCASMGSCVESLELWRLSSSP